MRQTSRRIGLDEARSWIVFSEYNEFTCNPLSMTYGFLTPGFFQTVRDRCIEVIRERKARRVARDA